MPNFAALEQRLSRTATTHLSNATAVWLLGGQGGAAVGGLRVVFDRPTALALDGIVSDTNPTASVFAQDMQGAARGDVLQITPDAPSQPGQVFTFEVARAAPDGCGLLTLELREAS
jgi:hypothetical protein